MAKHYAASAASGASSELSVAPSSCKQPTTAGSMPAEVSFGARMGAPVFLGYLPLGLAFGVLAVKSGIPPLWAVAMSMLAYAGAGQLICAGMVAGGASVLSIVIANAMINLRYMLMSAALAPYMGPFSRLLRALFSLEITDETFAVHSTAFRGGGPCRAPRLFACNVVAHSGWILGTGIGVMSGGMIADVRPFGLDFALPAMFLALLVPLCWERLHLVVALFAALASLLLSHLGTGRWSVILATVLAASLGLCLSVRRGDDLRRTGHE